MTDRTHLPEPLLPGLKVAIVHDWLTGMRGGEKCLDVFCELFPTADLYTLVAIPENVSARIREHTIRTSFIQSLPFARRKHQIWFPLFPAAVERFELSGYDLVLSSSHCVAKGVVTRPHTLHICYCYTPMRYAWDFYNLYLERTRPAWLARLLLPYAINYMRSWDEASAHRVDGYVAISHTVRRRIAKYYRRDSTVIYPPVDTDTFTPGAAEGAYYLVVSAMVPYKRDDLAVKVLTQRGARFVVVGDGPERRHLEALAGGRGEFRGRLPGPELVDTYRRAKALIYSGEEDFGIVPLEANSCGRPVIAFKAGGALETQVEGQTAVFFAEQSESALSAAIDRFEQSAWNPAAIRENALRFSRPRFAETIAAHLQECWEEFESGGRERPDVSA